LLLWQGLGGKIAPLSAKIYPMGLANPPISHVEGLLPFIIISETKNGA
jgi:hypothetical protein